MTIITGAHRRPTAPPPVPPFRPGSFRSRLHDPAPAAWLGVALGVTFGTCALTGLVSHLIQSGGSLLEHDVVSGGGWALWPTAPAWLYRVTQGLHVVSGFASVPLLLVKLFVVYPLLYTWPPVRGLRHLIERASLGVLVGGSLFLLVTGVQNVMYWYPWGFFFPVGHYWAAWVTIGALVMHVGAKSHVVVRVWRGQSMTAASRDDPGAPETAAADEGDRAPDVPDEVASSQGDLQGADGRGRDPGAGPDGGLTRRGLLVATAAASGLVVATVAGGTVRPLEGIAYLSLRSPSVGPQGFPVNKTAANADVVDTATSERWRLRIVGNVERELELSRADLADRSLRQAVLPIACVEGWSATVRWGGVPVRDLLAEAGARDGRLVRIESLQRRGFYRSSDLSPRLAADPVTLLALEVEGEPLHLDHGYPLRLIAPNNPGVLQTKWVSTVRVL